ncbi:TIGR02302 family protein [Pseudosulfitobacter sp. SM2401]|uniref:TIGR02302 family protein n=1 Tax=Pseudosulfitobacter sp. SM2401 TaxID=3350098 RepID=UPI0036F233BB
MASNFSRHDIRRGLDALRWPLRWTWAGMLAEAIANALWPLMTIVLLVLAVLMLGLHELVAIEAVWIGAVVAAVAGIAALIYAFMRFRIPTGFAAMERLDASLPGRPIKALMDTQAIGATDDASTAVWRAHQQRMATRAAAAEAVPADLRIARRDPYAVRYVAAIAFAIALLFGSIFKVASVSDMTPGGQALAQGPVWEGWVESPRYTGRPTLYLNDIAEGPLQVPEGSLITLRMYGQVGALTLSETVSGRIDVPPASDSAQDFTVLQDGEIAINGPGGRAWNIEIIEDAAPVVSILEPPEAGTLGEMTLPFAAADDYGVEAGEARISLDLSAVTRRHGLTAAPEARPELIMPLPMPIVGTRTEFEENLIEDFSEHPWANLPVQVRLSVLDAAEQQTESDVHTMLLPGRRFFDPMAAAVIEQRRDLLWSRENSTRVSQILRAVSHRPDDVFRKQVTYLRLRKLVKRLETLVRLDQLDADTRDEIAEDLWGLAIELEEGDLADALDRMRRAQERLEQAMRDGASNAEIAELMQELRQATEDYMRQLAQQQSQENQQAGEDGQEQGGERMQLSQDDLQAMMDRIQELMEQGRMAEAEQALKEFQEMMENMRVTQGEGGEGQSEGQQAMEGLSESLREQQGLSDQAFRDLQEQFNPNAQAGESEGNRGRNGGQGEGQNHEGQGGQGDGEGEGQSGDQAQSGDQQGQGSLADRQQALREELRRQQGALPGAGTPEGDAARDALDRAGDAMDNAEQALRNDDMAGAIDNQAQAMEALREGLQSLGEALAQEQNQQQGQGQQQADRQGPSSDPLGRDQNGSGSSENAEGNIGDEDVYRRARDLLAEIRRRSAQGERPEQELDYLKRLLDRF